MKLSIITISLLLVGSTMFAGELDDLKAQIATMQKKIEAIEARKNDVQVAEIEEAVNKRVAEIQKTVDAAEADREELWEIAEKTETKAFSNKLSWSADLGFRIDSFSYNNKGMGSNIGKPYDPNASKPKRREMAFPQKKEWDPFYSGTLKLAAKAQLTNNTSFTGRILTNWSSQGDQRICKLSPQDIGKDLPSASSTKFRAIDVDRAYFNYRFNIDGSVPMVFSLGILPTTGGMGLNMMENKPRKSVFPSLIFDSNVQGAILTTNISDIIGMDNTYVRAIYGKGFTLDDGSFYYQCNRLNIQDMDVMGLFLETELKFLGVDNTFWVGINQNSDIKATPFLGGDSAENEGSNSKIKNQQPLGDITNYGLGIEATDMFDGKLDAFIHYAISDPDSNGNCVNYTSQDLSKTNPNCTGIGTKPNLNPYFDTIAGGTLLNDKGSSIYLGFKYDTKSSWGTMFGYEFNKGDESWWSATQGSEDPYNKLSIRGTVHEAYIIQPVTSNISARIGYLRMQEDYTGSGWHFGTSDGSDSHNMDALQENFYLKVNAFF